MNTDYMEKALAGLENSVLDSVLAQRYERLSGTAKRKRPAKMVWRAAAGVAAMVVLVCGLTFPWWRELAGQIITQPTAQTKPSSSSTIPPNLIPAHSTPTPEEVYSLEPFATLLPQRILSDTVWNKSYKLENDPRLGVYNPCHLSMFYRSTAGEDTLSITVIRYDPAGRHADLSNPNTYSFSLYYGAVEQGLSESQLTSVFGMISAENITEELMNDRIYVFKDGLCQAGISVICGDYVVQYHYSAYGRAITGAEFYDMVVSSNWFQSAI